MRLYRTLASVDEYGNVKLNFCNKGTDEDMCELAIECVDNPSIAAWWYGWKDNMSPNGWFKVEVEM